MKCDFPAGCDQELRDGFCPKHGKNKAWGAGHFLILLTERLDDGWSDGVDFSNRGVFSSLEKIKQVLNREHEGRTIEHFEDGVGRGRFKISAAGLGSAFDVCYDYQTIGLDKMID